MKQTLASQANVSKGGIGLFSLGRFMNRCRLPMIAWFLCLSMLLCACNKPPVEEPAPEPSVEQDAEEEQEPEQKPEQEPPMSEIARKLEENTPFEIVAKGVKLSPEDFEQQGSVFYVKNGVVPSAYPLGYEAGSLIVSFKPSYSNPSQMPKSEDFGEIQILEIKELKIHELETQYAEAPFFWRIWITFENQTVEEFFDLADRLSQRADVFEVHPMPVMTHYENIDL